MVKDILVCLEGSTSSAAAAEVAIDLAQGLQATLVGLAIIDEPDIRAWQPTGIGGGSYKRQRDEVLLEDAQARAQEWLDGFATQCQRAGVPVRTLELRGRPAATILDEIQGHDLTIFGRHANFRFETEDSDTRTRETILRRSGRPVLMVPESERARGRAVLVAYDGSTASRRALESFASSGLATNRPIHLAAVDDDGATAWDIATRGCQRLAELGITATPHNVVPPDSVADAILTRREQLHAGLLVMGAYTRSRVARLLWGSVTNEIIDRTAVPLYLHY